MNLAQPVDQELFGFGVVLKPQGIILFDHLCDALGDLAFVALGCRGHSLDIVRLREYDLAVFKRFVPCQRIVRIRVVQLCNHTDVAAGKLLDLGLLLSAHSVNMRQLFVVARGVVPQGHVSTDAAVHHLEEGHLSDKRVGNGLEYENGRLPFGNDVDAAAVNQSFLLFGSVTREGFRNFIQHGPNAPQLGRRAAEHGHDFAVDDAFMDGVDRFHVRNLFAFEVLHHQFFVGACHRFHQHIAVFCGCLFGFIRNHLHAVATVCVKNMRALVDQVDRTDNLAAAHHHEANPAPDRTAPRCRQIC